MRLSFHHELSLAEVFGSVRFADDSRNLMVENGSISQDDSLHFGEFNSDGNCISQGEEKQWLSDDR